MAICDSKQLYRDALSNGFAALDGYPASVVMLQLLANIEGSGRSASELYAEACASGFGCLAENDQAFSAIFLQLLKSWSGTSQTIDAILADACASGFTCSADNAGAVDAIINQLLCNLQTP